MTEFLQIRVAFLHVTAWPTQRYDVTFPCVVGYKNADVRELFANLADTGSLRSNDESVQPLLYYNVP